MPRIIGTGQAIFTAQSTTAAGNPMRVTEFNHVLLRVSAALNSSLTYKIQGSALDTCPFFGSPQTETNHWDYVASYDVQAGSATLIPGDTGVTINNASVAANCIMLAIDTPFLQWIDVEVTSYTDGDLTVIGYGSND